MRLHLVATLARAGHCHALTGAKADQRTVLTDLTELESALTAAGPHTFIADKNEYGQDFEHAPVRISGGARFAEPSSVHAPASVR